MWKCKPYTYQLSDAEVIKRAKELGNPVQGLSGGGGTPLNDVFAQVQRTDEIRRQIYEAEREIRQRCQSWAAFWSAIASVIAAFAAWTAILFR